MEGGKKNKNKNKKLCVKRYGFQIKTKIFLKFLPFGYVSTAVVVPNASNSSVA